MKIYISHSTNFDYKNELYEPIKAAIGVTHEFYFPHDSYSDDINSKQIIITSDMILAEVSYPSTGQGIELGWAEDYGVTIIGLYKSGYSSSSALKLIGVDVNQYDSDATLLARIQEAIDQKNRP